MTNRVTITARAEVDADGNLSVTVLAGGVECGCKWCDGVKVCGCPPRCLDGPFLAVNSLESQIELVIENDEITSASIPSGASS